MQVQSIVSQNLFIYLKTQFNHLKLIETEEMSKEQMIEILLIIVMC